MASPEIHNKKTVQRIINAITGSMVQSALTTKQIRIGGQKQRPIFLRSVLISSLLLLLASCAQKPKGVATGWIINGEPLTSTQNAVLPTGGTLIYAEKFSLEAATDSVVRVTQPNPNEYHVNLLYGTAILTQHDAQMNVIIEVDTTRIYLSGARFLLQRKIGSSRLLLFAGSVAYENAGVRLRAAADAENLIEFSSAAQKRSKISLRDMLKYFPEVTSSRRLLAAK
jgi:hypothetical protein